MAITDTHVHVVAPDRDRYPVLENPPAWPSVTGGALAADMDALGVTRALLVQSFFTYGFDNSYAIDCAAADPARYQVVGVIDQTAPDAPEVLTRLVREHGVRGVRRRPSASGSARVSSAFRSPWQPRSSTCQRCPRWWSGSRTLWCALSTCGA
jgi:predicted TIM-barrel fold metal-dependent hydrolase